MLNIRYGAKNMRYTMWPLANIMWTESLGYISFHSLPYRAFVYMFILNIRKATSIQVQFGALWNVVYGCDCAFH